MINGGRWTLSGAGTGEAVSAGRLVDRQLRGALTALLSQEDAACVLALGEKRR